MEKHRLQFDFSEKATQRLDEMVEQLHASSRAEVVRKALALLDHLSQAREQGGVVIIRTGERERELLIL
jgi:metal-responsive CopG/Arc/MetJ family transcriptional regulator